MEQRTVKAGEKEGERTNEVTLLHLFCCRGRKRESEREKKEKKKKEKEMESIVTIGLFVQNKQ